nr:MAG TPA: hypothetical protein [Bacteriophage sp.]
MVIYSLKKNYRNSYLYLELIRNYRIINRWEI